MILGVDLGNYATKTSKEIIFASKCSRIGNILKNTTLRTDQGTFYIEEGTHDTEYRKIKKEFLKPLFINAIAMSSTDSYNKVVVGLPLSQYKQDSEALKNILLTDRMQNVSINNGPTRKIILEDVSVYPEGLGSVVGTDFEGIIVDVGGRTTDACLITDKDGAKKVNNPYSMPIGTLNLYSELIKIINSKGLDLKMDDAERILKNGLKVDGHPIDFTPAMEVFKKYVNELVNNLQIEYSIRTQEVLLIGGGCQLLQAAIKNRVPNARMIENPVFSNANGFKRIGDSLWR